MERIFDQCYKIIPDITLTLSELDFSLKSASEEHSENAHNHIFHNIYKVYPIATFPSKPAARRLLLTTRLSH